MPDESPTVANPARPKDTIAAVLSWFSVICCAPAVLGVLGTVVPVLTRPGRSWSLATPWDRAFTAIFEGSTVAALLSPLATAVGCVLAVLVIRRAGWSATESKVVVGAAGSALFLTIAAGIWFYATLHRGPDPAAERAFASPPVAIRPLHDACFAGDASACVRLGAKYGSGEEVPQSGTVAARYYVRACDLGESNGCMNGGTLFFYGGADPAPDAATGLGLLERACQQEHALGCLKIGIVYQLGHGVEADHVAAGAYFERACKLGLTDGCKWSREMQGQ